MKRFLEKINHDLPGKTIFLQCFRKYPYPSLDRTWQSIGPEDVVSR